MLGDKWKALSEKQREPYEKKAATDKKRYEDEKAKYNVSLPSHGTSRTMLTAARLVMRMKMRNRRVFPSTQSLIAPSELG